MRGVSVSFDSNIKDFTKRLSVLRQRRTCFNIYTLNIFKDQTCSISFSNDWKYHRQGTALHEFMHALGFEHEHCRKDRDFFVYIKENEIENSDEKRQYSIANLPKELTIFDPFSVMLYGESNRIKRDPRSRLWKLK